MSYELGFKKTALKEWNKLGSTIQTHFKKKLRNVLSNPRIPGSKLRQSGYRLVYEVSDQLVMVTVIAVGKREGAKVYKAAMKRTSL